MFEWTDAVREINNADSIAVLTHTSADGDSLGSAFALAIELKKSGKEVCIYLEENVQDKLRFLMDDEIQTVIVESDNNVKQYDLAIAVDCGDAKRLGKRINIFNSAKITIKIDHHISNDDFAVFNYVDINWSATCEAIWELIIKLKNEITKEAALRIYSGIYTDTGSFSFSNTKSSTHSIEGDIFKQLGDLSYVSRKFAEKKKSMINLYSIAIPKIEYFDSGMIAYLYLSTEDFEKAGAIYEDGEGLSGYIRDIEGVDTSIYVKPGINESELKVSMRSNELCDVAYVAASMSGGGHKRAAGFTFTGDFNSLKQEIIEKVERNINETRCDS